VETLHLVWFVLLGILLAGYAILDGFDLGVGILHPFVRQDTDRRLLMNSIGPLWDGNEVWLVVFGGALFAAFPRAYAAAFSGLYLAFFLILACLIFRGVSLEFRGKQDWRWWRAGWDFSFFASSTLATFLFGVAVGNATRGLPLGADGDFDRAPTLGELLGPYPVAVGLFAIATFAMHGSIYLYLKTEGELQERIHRWMWRTFYIFLAGYITLTIWTVVAIPHATANFKQYPWTWIVPVLNVLAVANIPRAIYLGQPLYAFASSACAIAAFTFLFGMSLFPNLIVSNLDPEWNLTVQSAASSTKTLTIMTIIAIIGLPFVLTYTITIYWIFRGKTKLDRFSY
jgi:cytochrome d ubiquinol oxidase subunit II